eukprot:72096-Pyramimonas_sp.AAC.1
MVRTTRRPKFAALSLCYHVEFAAKPLTTHAHAARLGHLLLFPGAPPVSYTHLTLPTILLV